MVKQTAAMLNICEECTPCLTKFTLLKVVNALVGVFLSTSICYSTKEGRMVREDLVRFRLHQEQHNSAMRATGMSIDP